MDQPQRPSAPSRPAPSRPPKGLFPTDSDTHILDRLNAIYKYRYIAISVFLLVMLGVAVRTFMTTPMYRATTTVLIDDERGASVAGFNATSGNDYQDPEPYFQTQLRILQGRELAGKVSQRLRLETLPEYNGKGPERTGVSSVLHTMQAEVRNTPRRIAGGAPAAENPSAAPSQDALTSAFLGSVSLEPVRGSRLVNVSVTSPNAAFAARAADTLVEEYVKQNFELRTEATKRSLDFLSDEIGKQQKKVEESERAMADYREHNNALSLEGTQNTVVASLNPLNHKSTKAKTGHIQKEAP